MPYDIYSQTNVSDSSGESLRQFAIECIDVVMKNVYFGTADGNVVHYILDETNLSSFVRQNIRFLGVKKPILQLKCASNRVLTLCDAGIWLLNAFDLEHSAAARIPKLKEVTCFAVNESPANTGSNAKSNPFWIDVAVAHRLKRALSLYRVDADCRFLLQKEIQLPEVLMSMVYDGPCVCAALADRYCVVNCNEAEGAGVTDVLFYEELITRPLVRLVTRTSFIPNLASANASDFVTVPPEFAIIGPDRLCVFVGANGPSSRAPIPLHVSGPTSPTTSSLIDLLVVADSPYLVALAADSTLFVHSTLDCGTATATLKQSLVMNSATCLANLVVGTANQTENTSRVLVGTKRGGVQALVALSLDDQVMALLRERKPFEAFELLQSAKVIERARVAARRDAYDRLVRVVAAHCGFARFAEGQFDEARRFFLDAHLDVRELLALFGDLRLQLDGEKGKYTRQLALEISDIETLCRQRLASSYLQNTGTDAVDDSNQSRLSLMRAEYYQFALHFLVETRSALRLRRAESIAFAIETTTSPAASTSTLASQLSIVDTALVQLYAVVDARSLEAFLTSNAISSPQSTLPQAASCTSSTLHCDAASCRAFCESRGAHFCVALIDAYVAYDHEAACVRLARLIRAELADSAFPGVDWFANYLGQRDSQLLLRYVQLILERDATLGVSLLAERTRFTGPAFPTQRATRGDSMNNSASKGRTSSALQVRTQTAQGSGQNAAVSDADRLDADTVVDFLQQFPIANAKYLEFLVLDRRVGSERFHTQLAALLSDALITALRDAGGNLDLLLADEKITQIRATLCRVLEESNLYRVQSVLHRLNDTPFYQELTILYSKLGEHERALRLMIHKMNDLAGAEQYCLRVSASNSSSASTSKGDERNRDESVQNAGVDSPLRKQLFFTLLGILLEDARLAHAAIALLNRLETNCVETVRTLSAVPSDWQLAAVDRFVLKTLHELVTRSALACIGVQLARFEQLEVRAALCRAQRAKIVLTDERVCSVCNRLFEQASFVLHRNGAITHIHCSGSIAS